MRNVMIIKTPKMKYWDKGRKQPKFDFGILTYENGSLERLERINAEGERDGLSEYWSEFGRKQMEINFKDDKMHGAMTHWYENGIEQLKKHYKDGELHGPYTLWNAKGIRQQRTEYQNGLQVGPIIKYDSKGKKI